jgi:hypothetical protein
VILRVAPEPGQQNRIERHLMRNEHASLPYFAPIAHMMPRTLAVDFTHEVIGRDYLVQTMLPGVPARDGLDAYPRPRWAAYFRQMGSIAHRIHSVRGPRFGPVAGPAFASGPAPSATVSGSPTGSCRRLPKPRCDGSSISHGTSARTGWSDTGSGSSMTCRAPMTTCGRSSRNCTPDRRHRVRRPRRRDGSGSVLGGGRRGLGGGR